MATLSDDEIAKRMKALPGWTREGDGLRRTFTFPRFADAITFVNRVAEHAERLDHHPDILVEYTKVTLTSTSHDAGGITARDFALATAVSG